MDEKAAKRAAQWAGIRPILFGAYTSAMGVVMLVIFGILVYLLFAIWPVKYVNGASCSPAVVAKDFVYEPCANIFGWTKVRIGDDLRLLYIVFVAGGIGSFIQLATSFSTYVGNRRFLSSWTWWYVLRTPIGISLAFLFYMAIRGGLMTPTSTASDVSVFGVAAVSGLVGLFSKQAADKLRDIFETAFQPRPGSGDAQRADPLTRTAPAIKSIAPSEISVAKASKPVAIRVEGTGFVAESSVQINRQPRQTLFMDATTLSVALTDVDLVAGTTLGVTVVNPDGGKGTSPILLTISN